MSHHPLDFAAKFPQPQAVEYDVQPAKVQKSRSDQAPVLAPYAVKDRFAVNQLEWRESEQAQPGHGCMQVNNQETGNAAQYQHCGNRHTPPAYAGHQWRWSALIRKLYGYIAGAPGPIQCNHFRGLGCMLYSQHLLAVRLENPVHHSSLLQ